MMSIAITFIYGSVLPILFPIAMFKSISDYFLERYLVLFYYKEPPAYDETMTMNFIKCCRIIVMVAFAFSFW